MKKQRLGEIIRFVIAGGAGFAVEIGLLILLKEKLGMDTLIATPIAFTVSVIVNYLICVFWVFSGAREQSRQSTGIIMKEMYGSFASITTCSAATIRIPRWCTATGISLKRISIRAVCI